MGTTAARDSSSRKRKTRCAASWFERVVPLNFKEILELIDKVAERGIVSLEIEQAGTKLRIEGKSAPPAPQVIHSYVGEKSDAPLISAVPLTVLPSVAASAVTSPAQSAAKA